MIKPKQGVGERAPPVVFQPGMSYQEEAPAYIQH